jgi:hypothetical protein
MSIEIVRQACSIVESELARDPTAALNEAELQALLQAALLSIGPAYLPARLAPEVIRHMHHPDLMVQRVFRELKLDGGRGGKEADLVLLQDRPQIVEAKQNGAPARFRGPFAAIVETKIDASAMSMLSAGKVRPRVDALISDIAKWRQYADAGLVDQVVAVVMTAEPAAYSGLDNVVTIQRSPASLSDWEPTLTIDPWHLIDVALEEVADEYRRYPMGCIREKDFETRLFTRLRSARLPKAKLTLPNGRSIGIDPVRAQWSGEWSSVLGRGRRHDLIVLDPSGASLLAELELKTSHSDSHNWFRKREVEGELDAMHRLVEHDLLKRGRFVMFRYGSRMWEDDAHKLFSRYPNVEFAYHAT